MNILKDAYSKLKRIKLTGYLHTIIMLMILIGFIILSAYLVRARISFYEEQGKPIIEVIGEEVKSISDEFNKGYNNDSIK